MSGLAGGVRRGAGKTRLPCLLASTDQITLDWHVLVTLLEVLLLKLGQALDWHKEWLSEKAGTMRKEKQNRNHIGTEPILLCG